VGGALFLLKYWRHYNELPREKNRELLLVSPGILSVDCTFKAGGSSRVGMVLGFPWKANLYIEWTYAKSMGLVDTCAKIKWACDHFIDWKTNTPMIGKVLIEKAANGEAVVDTLKDEVAGLVLCGVGADKMSRANAALPRVEAGNVRLKKDAPWDEEFTSELAQFPNGTYDDLVDAFAQLMAEVNAGGGNWRGLYS
jgi:predicted phage terminase large subunit-like protein